jgi:hypothetical protein
MGIFGQLGPQRAIKPTICIAHEAYEDRIAKHLQVFISHALQRRRIEKLSASNMSQEEMCIAEHTGNAFVKNKYIIWEETQTTLRQLPLGNRMRRWEVMRGKRISFWYSF